MNQFAFRVVIFACLFQSLGQAQELQTTTFYVVRHAERDGTNDALTEVGNQRAKELATLMKSLRIGAIYSTDTQRTQSTARPTAEALELTVQSYGNLTSEWFEELKEQHPGKAILIVGHSNTSGQIVNGLGGEGDFSLEEDEYDNLFVVTVTGDKTNALKIKYGDTPDH